ncbi:hypothetical protein OG563_18825 [Nocardia vinacea]|uniref:MFS transporter n=1 Tax=Nocardia vinacea TaxID=96468 RepID=A0ABZ1Z3E9_9NOCA|nr:hypothetical protein [Nocardia vinacea]
MDHRRVLVRGLDLSQVPSAQTGAASESLGGATEFARQLPQSAADGFLTSVHEAFVSGVHMAAIGTAVVLLIAAVVAFRLRTARA